MIKRVLIGMLAVLLMVGVAAFAGPTLSVGTAWYNDSFDFGFGVGLQSNRVIGDFLGAEAEFIVADIGIDPYDDPTESDYSYLLGFSRINLTFALSDPDAGLQWYFLYGIGSPLILQWDNDNVATNGVNIGSVFGFACEVPAGHGLTVLGYWEDGEFAVGAEVYIDLYGLAAKRIVEFDTTVSTAEVGEPTPLVPANPCGD